MYAHYVISVVLLNIKNIIRIDAKKGVCYHAFICALSTPMCIIQNYLLNHQCLPTFFLIFIFNINSTYNIFRSITQYLTWTILERQCLSRHVQFILMYNILGKVYGICHQRRVCMKLESELNLIYLSQTLFHVITNVKKLFDVYLYDTKFVTPC